MNKKVITPKARKHPQLFQHYLWWNEFVELRKRHTLRISAVERGASNFDAQLEKDWLEYINVDDLIKAHLKAMEGYGIAVGPIWDWLIAIKGIGAGQAAKLLAEIDDIALFANISKLWRFSGLAVINGKAERNQKGEKSHFNRRLKSVCWQTCDLFIKHQTPVYVDYYYDRKAKLRELHPEKYKNDEGKWMYNDGHIHIMAMRKTEKLFLSHLWVQWRTFDELPVSKPWAHDVDGHTNYIEPPPL